MNKNQNLIENIFNELKKNENNFILKISNQYNLVPIRFYDLLDEDLIKIFSKWRNANYLAFPGKKKTNYLNTSNWLNNNVLNDNKRILFKIINSNKELIGHIGLKLNYGLLNEIELDNVLRGEKSNEKKIMSLSIKSLAKWSANKLQIDKMFLKVLTTNTHAIKFYEKNDFSKVRTLKITQNINASKSIDALNEEYLIMYLNKLN